MKDVVVVVGSIMLALTAFFLVAVIGHSAVKQAQCASYGEMTQKAHKLVYLDTCYLNNGGKWQTWAEYRASGGRE